MHKQLYKEKGQGSIELAIAVPILLLFVCVIVDMSAFAYSWTSADQAATEAVRTLVVDPQATDAACSAAALLAAPNLNPAHTSVSVSRSPSASESYEHHLGGPGGFVQRPSHAQTSEVSVKVTYESTWFTPVGAVIGAAAGMPSGKMLVTASKQAAVDTTVLGGAW